MTRQTRKRRIINFVGISVFFLLFVLCGATGYTQDNPKRALPIEVKAEVDKQDITIGDKVRYTITVKADKGIEIDFGDFAGNVAQFAVKDFGVSTKGLWGKKTHQQWYILDTYTSGEQIIPASIVKYRRKGEKQWSEADVDEVKVNVKGVVDASESSSEIRGIRGPKTFKSKTFFYLLLAAVAVLICAGIGWFISARKKEYAQKILPKPAHEIAYQALDELKKKEYPRIGEIKQYYIELSDIVRRYLENRFNIRAPEMTTEEFLYKVRNDKTLSYDCKSLLREFLLDCDLVKFAKHQPREIDINTSFEAAKKLIDQTKEKDFEKDPLDLTVKDR